MSGTEPAPVRGLVSARASALTSSRLAHLMRVARERNAIDPALGVPGYPEPPDWRYDPRELTAAFGPRTRALLVADVRPVDDEGSNASVRRTGYEAGVLLAPGAVCTADAARGRQFVRVAFNRRRETLERAERKLASGLLGSRGQHGRGATVRQLRMTA
ncbi:hypothetical protein [Salinispora pacifica]|uniref:hypothetical protein n=1 Tax=Salinispora pacifica TaxID=351187 RepID=UPI0003AB42C9|nr:hypothetical protein [Salinispora pacifica]